MPLEVIQRLIGLLIGGFLPTDKQVNHELTLYMTDCYAHRLGSSFMMHRGLSCGACFEQPNPVYFVLFFIKLKQISLIKYGLNEHRTPFLSNIRILFDYTDKAPELCRKL